MKTKYQPRKGDAVYVYCYQSPLGSLFPLAGSARIVNIHPRERFPYEVEFGDGKRHCYALFEISNSDPDDA